jgi:hypothetical protein
MRWVTRTIAAACVLAGASAYAQTTEPAPLAVEPAAVAAETPPAPTTVTIPAGATILVEFTETLSSRTSQTGQLVGLRLVEPIYVNGQTIVEAGATGGGEVIDASRSGMGGRSGKLIVSGRFIEIAGQRARIRGLQVVIAGEDNSREAVNTMILVPYVGWMGGFIQGGEIEIPAGTRAEARFATNVVVPMPAAQPVAAGQTAAVTPEQTSGVEDTQ